MLRAALGAVRFVGRGRLRLGAFAFRSGGSLSRGYLRELLRVYQRVMHRQAVSRPLLGVLDVGQPDGGDVAPIALRAMPLTGVIAVVGLKDRDVVFNAIEANRLAMLLISADCRHGRRSLRVRRKSRD